MPTNPEQPEKILSTRLKQAVEQETHHGQETPTHEIEQVATAAGLSAEDCLQAQQALDFLNTVKAAMSSTQSVQDADATNQEIPSYIGRYKILSSLGRGGFSEVFLGEDESLLRRAAIKVPLLVGTRRSEYQARFEREAMASALLTHPSIVPIYEFDVIGPLAFIAYRWLPGQNLAEFLRANGDSLSLRDRVEIVAQLADAIEHAHQRGVIHRDLKPANILVDESRERQTEPLAQRVLVADFGLAHYNGDDDQKLTREGTTLGTPSYMSPEQAAGASNITSATDIYALGVILFELLTGEVPFRKDTLMATLQAVQHDPIPRLKPRRSEVRIPQDVEAICLKCLQKAPTDRYASAYDLSADLRRWLNGFPVKARRPTILDRTRAWAKRNPALTALTALAVLFFTAGIAGTTWQWQNAKANAERFRLEFERAESNRIQAEQSADQEKLQRIRAEKIAVFLGSTYRSADPSRDGREVKVVEVLNRAEQEIAQQFADDDQTRWSLWLQLARAWQSLGQFDGAQRILDIMGPELAASVVEPNLLKVEYFDVAALVANGQGKYETALELTNIAIQEAEQITDFPDRTLWKLKRNVASHLSNLGKLVEANSIRASAVLFLRTDPDANREELLNAEVDWAVGLAQTGQHSDAEQILTELIPALESDLGRNHTTTLLAKSILTKALMAQNKTTGLVTLHQDMLEGVTDKFGEEHPETARAMHNLGVVLKRENQGEEARRYFMLAADLSEKIHGKTSPYRSVSLTEVARIDRDQGDWENSISSYAEAVEGLRASVGPLHSRTIGVWVEYLDTLEFSQRYTEADEGWQEILDLEADEGRNESTLSEIAKFRRGMLAIAQGNQDAGLQMVDKFFEYLSEETNLPDHNLILLKSHATLLAALLKQEAFEEMHPIATRYCELAPESGSRAYEELLAESIAATVQLKLDGLNAAAPHLQKLLAAEKNLNGLLYLEKQTLLSSLSAILEATESMPADNDSSLNRESIEAILNQVRSTPNRFR